MAKGMIMTVTGPIYPAEMGLCLSHEHILTDLRPPREQTVDYSPEMVAKRMLPLLLAVKRQGVKAIVECTPMYIGRDPAILKELSEKSGLYIITNTGLYKQPFLPESAYTSNAPELAAAWIKEYEDGIVDGIRPGFIKTAVPETGLDAVNETVIRAAAITCRETGLTIGTHTCTHLAASQVVNILKQERVPLDRWTFIHAQAEQDPETLLQYARQGAYISLDGLHADSAERHLHAMNLLLRHGFSDRILLSHDSGWYTPGKANGGDVNGYTYLLDGFMPYAQQNGVAQDILLRILTDNVRSAFTIG